jgi:hypothetical protein
MNKLTQSFLQKYFTYSSDTGEFHRLFIRDRWGNETPVIKKVGTVRDDGYLEINILNKVYKSHRLAWLYMTGVWPDEVDHVNGVRSDNRWCNLREVDKHANMKNRGLNHNNTSGTSGITWFKDTNQWRVRINHDGRRISLGLFDTIDEAVAARKGAERILGYHENHGKRPSWEN